MHGRFGMFEARFSMGWHDGIMYAYTCAQEKANHFLLAKSELPGR